MFVQVIQGRVTDAAALRRGMDDWVERLAPSATGWRGATAGVTEDGTLVEVVLFDSAEAARRNSGRAEQGEWWSGVSKLFEGEVTFHDCTEVAAVRRGMVPEAGFVQVMQGRARDLDRLREADRMFEERYPDLRPELLGYLVALHDGGDGAFTLAAYFTSEEEARAGEQGEPPPEAAELLREQMALMEDLTYVDLREPWSFVR